MIISGSSYLLNYVSGKFIELPSNQIVIGDRNYLYAETGIAIGKFNFNSGVIPTGLDFFAPSAAIGYANDIQNVNENFILGFANLSYDGNNKYIIGRLNYLDSGSDIYAIGGSNNIDYCNSLGLIGSNNYISDGNANYIIGDSHNIFSGTVITNIGNNNNSTNNQSINIIGSANTDTNGSTNNIIGNSNASLDNSSANLIGNSNSAKNSNTNILVGGFNTLNSGDTSLLFGFSNSLLASVGFIGFVNIEGAGASYLNTNYYAIDDSTGVNGVYSIDPLNPFGSSTIYNDGSIWKVYSENDGQDVYYSLGQFFNPWQVTGWNFYDPIWSGAPVLGGVTFGTEEVIDGNVGTNNILIGNYNISSDSTSALILGNNNFNSNLNNKIIGDSNSNAFSGASNFLVGNGNILNDQFITGNYLAGNFNTIQNVNSNYIGGNNQSLYNISNSILVGNSNFVSGDILSNGFLSVGNSNVLYGSNNISVGNTNLVLGNSNSAFGTSNTIGTGAQSCLVFGRNQNLTGLNEVGKIRLGTSSSTNLSIKLDKVEITSLLEPTINDQKIITSAHTGELVSLNKLASFEYLSLSGQTFTQLNIVDNEMDHLADQINIINGGLNASYISNYSPNSGYSGMKNGTIFISTGNFYKTPVSAYQGIYGFSGSYFYYNANDSLDIIYTTSLTPSRWMIANSTGAGFYFYNNGDGNTFPVSNWVRTGSNISNSGFNPPPNFSTGIVTSSVNQRYKLTNNFTSNFNPTYASALTNYYLSEDNYFSLIYGNNTSGNLFPIANSVSGLKLANQWMIIETIGSGFYYFIDTTGSNGTTVPYTGFVSTGQRLLTTGQGTSPNPEMTLQIGSRTGIVGSFHPDYGRIYVPFYY
jgi:hypothetical protein